MSKDYRPCECIILQDMLTECITKKLPILLLRGQVRLIIIDSIAALFRCEFAAKDAVVKAKHLQTIGAKLHQLSRDFTTPVFCINQVFSMCQFFI